MRLLLPLAAVCLVQLANAAARNYGNLCEPIYSKYNPKGIMEMLQASKKKKEEQLQKEYEAYINRYDPEKYHISIQGDGIFVVPKTTKTTKAPTTTKPTTTAPPPTIKDLAPTPPQPTPKQDGPPTPPKVETTSAAETTPEATSEATTEATTETTPEATSESTSEVTTEAISTEETTRIPTEKLTTEAPKETTKVIKIDDVIPPKVEATIKPIQLVTVGLQTLVITNKNSIEFDFSSPSPQSQVCS